MLAWFGSKGRPAESDRNSGGNNTTTQIDLPEKNNDGLNFRNIFSRLREQANLMWLPEDTKLFQDIVDFEPYTESVQNGKKSCRGDGHEKSLGRPKPVAYSTYGQKTHLGNGP